ncbi:UNVERIFIED_CONTAM: hypothetical protein Slati_2399900 [Sesamum latifolium]|uniref:Reverse transcriptase/retrotransposon-derived protein RNase H-like domain-containing protein n=1 Tax=Sesamum latifolium TaxID=2727402 RepID=A0AAW2WCX9_9LAMI
MKPPVNLNEVQRLAGRITTLSRFISRSAECNLPFFKALRKTKNFVWDEECQHAFHDLKTYLAELPLLTKPTPGKLLYLYLAVGQQAIISVLIKEEEEHQKPIYYVSKVLHGAEQRYPEIETNWRNPLLDYLAKRILPAGEMEAACLKTRQPTLLYWMEGRNILQEIHEGTCGSHVGDMALANNTLPAGYFWPTLSKDAINWAKRC